MNVINFRHTGIVVSNLNLELKFYKELLGLDVIKETNENKSFINKILDIDGSGLRTVKLGKGDKIFLELLKFNTTKDSNSKKELKPDDIGITHFAITVDDLVEVYDYLRKNGIYFLSPPEISADKCAKVAFCKDFENNLVELVEVLK